MKGQNSFDQFLEALEAEFGIAEEPSQIPFPEYANDPEGFITEKLGCWLTEQQRTICRSVRDERETNVQASHGCGKCVAQNSTILLSNGMEVPAKSLVGRWFETLTLVDGKVTPVEAFADWNRQEPVYEVVTETGKRIVRNAKHPLFAAVKWSRDGAHPIFDVHEWTGVATLQKWMVDPPLYEASKFTPEDWAVQKDRKHSVVCAMPEEIPVFGKDSLPDHEIKLIAYLIGDGGLTARTPMFSQKEGPQLDEVRACALQMGCVLFKKNRYDYAIANPVGQRHTHGVRHAPALLESGDFSCAQHTSTRRIKCLNGHSDKTLYDRLKLLGIKPVKFYGRVYMSASEVELYSHYDECLKQSRVARRKGSPKGNSALAMELLAPIRDSLVMRPVDLDLLESQKQAAIKSSKISAGIQPGTRRNGVKPNPVAELMKRHGLMGKGSAEKFVPEAIFQLCREPLALFLSRLFSTDGWACITASGRSASEIGFCSASRRLVEQVQRLLLRFGITGSIYRKPKVNAWTLSIRSSQMQLKFAKEIGIYGKEEAVSSVVEVAKTKSSSKQTPKWRKDKAPEGTVWEKVVSIRKLNDEDQTVAITVPDHNTFLTTFYEHNTFLAAQIVLYWTLAVGGLCITTAPTKRQVTELLWGEVRKAHSRLKLPGERGMTFLRLSEEARAFGFTASDTNSNAFQGVHHPRLLVIEDEACGISNDIDEGASSCATGAGNRFLRIGNPIEPGGAFEKACKRRHIRIPVWDHPNVSWAYQQEADGMHRLKPDVAAAIFDEAGEVRPPDEWPEWCPQDRIPGAVSVAWIEEARSKYGEGSAYWQSRVEGFFPEDSAQSIVPRTWFLAARARYDNNPEYWDEQAVNHSPRYGLDVGDGGDDHALGKWMGPVLYLAKGIPTKGDQEDVTRAAGLAIAALQKAGGSIHIDRGGCGSGAQAILKEQGHSSIGVHWGEAARDSAQYLNAKAEDFWMLREAFRKNEVAIAPLGDAEEMLMEDLAGIYWEMTSVGKIRIEDKEKTKKRLKRSPNVGDAVCLGFRQPAAKRIHRSGLKLY